MSEQATYSNLLKSLPQPSPEQYLRFCDHVADAHSWYKHLSLLHGGLFVVFLDPDAGERYPSQHPALPFGNTVEGYRKAFGHLNYAYLPNREDPGKRFYCDHGIYLQGSKIQADSLLPFGKTIWEHCSCVLYPYINHNGIETIFANRDFELLGIQQGRGNNPSKEKVMALYQAYHQLEEMLKALDGKDQAYIYLSDWKDLESGKMEKNTALMAYYQQHQYMHQLCDALQQEEVKKLYLALRSLWRLREEYR